MSNRGIVEFDPLFSAEVFELFGGEICSVIGDDAMWYTETEDDGPDEVDGSRGRCVCDCEVCLLGLAILEDSPRAS